MAANYLQLFFCKPPVAGTVKTRLGVALGMERAARIYTMLLKHVISLFPCEEIVLYSASDQNLNVLEDLFPGLGAIQIQSGATLGERMARALHDSYRSIIEDAIHDDGILKDDESRIRTNKPDYILLAGTDIPNYSPNVAQAACKLLQENDLVLGPCEDGGYYMIGVGLGLAAQSDVLQKLFADIPWSTPQVLELQRDRCRELGLRLGELEPLFDLDTFDDLSQWHSRGDCYVEKEFPDVRAILPVLNEAENLDYTLSPLFRSGYFREIICADNDSTDGSREIAESLGARTTFCTERGYGATCLQALEDIEARGGCEAVLFLDADGADDPAAIIELLRPILNAESDFTIGVRLPHLAEEGALLPQARFGNMLAVFLMRLVYGHSYQDLGPFRAISWQALRSLKMDDRNFGWTIQMQIRALQAGLRVKEIPVRYRKRKAGKSKVTASLRGAIKAGYIILTSIFKERFRSKHHE